MCPESMCYPIWSENQVGCLVFVIFPQGRTPKRPNLSFSVVPASPQQHCPCLRQALHAKCTRFVLTMINADNTFFTRWCHGLWALGEAQIHYRDPAPQTYMWPHESKPMTDFLLCLFCYVAAWLGCFFLN